MSPEGVILRNTMPGGYGVRGKWIRKRNDQKFDMEVTQMVKSKYNFTNRYRHVLEKVRDNRFVVFPGKVRHFRKYLNCKR